MQLVMEFVHPTLHNLQIQSRVCVDGSSGEGETSQDTAVFATVCVGLSRLTLTQWIRTPALVAGPSDTEEILHGISVSAQ